MITKETFVCVIKNYLDAIDSLHNFEKQLDTSHFQKEDNEIDFEM